MANSFTLRIFRTLKSFSFPNQANDAKVLKRYQYPSYNNNSSRISYYVDLLWKQVDNILLDSRCIAMNSLMQFKRNNIFFAA